jgi:hypothetical protein
MVSAGMRKKRVSVLRLGSARVRIYTVLLAKGAEINEFVRREFPMLGNIASVSPSTKL